MYAVLGSQWLHYLNCLRRSLCKAVPSRPVKSGITPTGPAARSLQRLLLPWSVFVSPPPRRSPLTVDLEHVGVVLGKNLMLPADVNVADNPVCAVPQHPRRDRSSIVASAPARMSRHLCSLNTGVSTETLRTRVAHLCSCSLVLRTTPLNHASSSTPTNKPCNVWPTGPYHRMNFRQ